MDELKIAVTSRSFSKNKFLREKICSIYKNVKFNDEGLKLEGDELVEFLKDCDKAIIALNQINDTVLEKLPKLKLISKYGVGLDNIKFEALTNNKVELSWKGGVNKRAVSELSLSFILMLTREVWVKSNELKRGKWNSSQTRSLKNSTIGLVGFGNIGQDMADVLSVFGAKIITYDIRELKKQSDEKKVQQLSLNELLAQSDIISIHLPKIKSTIDFVNEEFLSKMKSNAILINTSRGGIVNENALYQALKNSKISAAAMDVFKVEPQTQSPLLKLDNFVATPHIAGSSDEGIINMGMAAIEGLHSGKEAIWENFYDYPEE